MKVIEMPNREDATPTLLNKISKVLEEHDMTDFPADSYVLIGMAEGRPMCLLTSCAQDYFYLTEVGKLSLLAEQMV